MPQCLTWNRWEYRGCCNQKVCYQIYYSSPKDVGTPQSKDSVNRVSPQKKSQEV